jgi:uracil-DNA glycosylase
MLVGEYPSLEDERVGLPFQGGSGMELNRMLHEVGIMRSECYTTNVLKTRPPEGKVTAWVPMKKKDIGPQHSRLLNLMVTQEVHEGYNELLTEINMVQPNIIVAFGNLACWALTGNWSALKWRGSLLGGGEFPKVIPTIHPAGVLRQWDMRGIVLNDLRRVKRHMTSRVYDNIPKWNFTTRPSIEQVTTTIQMLMEKAKTQAELWLEFDLETFITTKHIRCAGISWSRTEAICIPFTDGHENYWGSADEEAYVVYLLYKLLTHPHVRVRGQNLLFDCQYTYRYWHFIPNVAHDTMISQHSCFAALPKSLDFLASMYADYYTYWKDDK